MEKAEARRIVRERIEQMTRRERAARGLRAQRRLLAMDEYAKARTVLTYMALDDEVPTAAINADATAKGKRLAAPFVHREGRRMEARVFTPRMRPGAFGIPESPDAKHIDPAEINFIVVPGRAFDNTGRRVGRGGGYYDRFLAESPQAVKCALCFECQVMEKLESRPHDVRVDFIATENTCYGFREKRR